MLTQITPASHLFYIVRSAHRISYAYSYAQACSEGADSFGAF